MMSAVKSAEADLGGQEPPGSAAGLVRHSGDVVVPKTGFTDAEWKALLTKKRRESYERKTGPNTSALSTMCPCHSKSCVSICSGSGLTGAFLKPLSDELCREWARRIGERDQMELGMHACACELHVFFLLPACVNTLVRVCRDKFQNKEHYRCRKSGNVSNCHDATIPSRPPPA